MIGMVKQVSSRAQLETEFQTTDWRMIADACAPSVATRKDGLGRVFIRYRAPMESWLCARGAGAERAAEITQGFFTDVVLHRDILASATEGRGRLRNLIKTALKRYWIDMIRRDEAREHAEHRAAEDREVTAIAAADAAFDAEWARTQLQLAIERVRARLEAAGRVQEWRIFEICILEPVLHHRTTPTMDEAARAVGVRNAATASNLLHQARRRMGSALHEVISETVGAAGDYGEEIAHVESLLRAAARR
jgi:hypothetical protein